MKKFTTSSASSSSSSKARASLKNRYNESSSSKFDTHFADPSTSQILFKSIGFEQDKGEYDEALTKAKDNEGSLYETPTKGKSSIETIHSTSIRESFFKSKPKVKVYLFILEHYEIPKDIDMNQRYGVARSGICHEERVLMAYKNGLLKIKKASSEMRMCWTCGLMGHFPCDCPNLIKY